MSSIEEEEKLSDNKLPDVSISLDEKTDTQIEEEEEEVEISNPKIGWMNLKFAKFNVVEEKIEKG
jgi:hypothetical protein